MMKNKNLHNINDTGFKVPKDYFDTFEDNLFEKVKGEKVLTDDVTSGFKTPKNYFESIEDKIIETVSEENETKVISLFNKKRIVYISSIAAAVLLLFSLSIFNNTPEFDDLETQTVENYIIDENISSYEIAALMSETQLNENDFVDYSFDEQNIEEYLLENADIEYLMIE